MPPFLMRVHWAGLSGCWQRFVPDSGRVHPVAMSASVTPSDTRNRIFCGEPAELPSPGAGISAFMLASTLSCGVSMSLLYEEFGTIMRSMLPACDFALGRLLVTGAFFVSPSEVAV